MSLLINPVLCRKGVMDNYAYIITDSETSTTAIIDASEPEPVILACQKLNVTPQYVLSTHHHFDHVGGNSALKEKYNVQIVVPFAEAQKFEESDILLQDGDIFKLGGIEIRAISAAGHTKGHLLYYAPEEKVLFTGDVLFNLSIGGLFEGTPAQMFESLQKIKLLPDDVLFYSGHEYTKYGLSQISSGENQAMQIYTKLATERLKQGLPVAPVKLGLEKQCNPYLMIDDQKIFENLF